VTLSGAFLDGRAWFRVPSRPKLRPMRAQRGQAAVELVAVLPVVLALLAGLWQLAVWGHASWAVAGAARAAARASAVGLDARAAARSVLPARLERGLRVARSGDGMVVRVRVPSVIGASVGRVSARAGFAPQR
jgi:Flp pilus assembly protein TadG